MLDDIIFEQWYSVKKFEEIIYAHVENEDVHDVENDKPLSDISVKFYQELLPILNYAQRCNAKEILYVDDSKQNNSYDGKIKLPDDSIIEIECTNAVCEDDAKEQTKRHKLCQQLGYAELPTISVEVNEFRENIFNIIKNAIDKKIDKSKKGNKYQGFYLIITFVSTNDYYCDNNTWLYVENKLKTYNINPFRKVILYRKIDSGYPKFIFEA